MARLFGFSIQDTEKIPPGVVSPVPENNADGSDHYLSSGPIHQHYSEEREIPHLVVSFPYPV